MKKAALFLLLVLTSMTLGFGGREVHEGLKHERNSAEMSKKGKTSAKVSDTDARIKVISKELIQKKEDMKERPPERHRIMPVRQQPIEVKPGAQDKKSLEKVIRTVGKVNYNDKRILTVAPKIGGRIDHLYIASSGGYIRQGEPLLSIYSAEMITAQEEYLLALRAKDEFSKSSFPEVARSGESLLESARRRLKTLLMTDEQIRTLEETRQARRTFNINAPESGYFLEKQSYKGMEILPDTVFKLADLYQVWVISDISESDLTFIRLGQQAVIKSEAIPGETFSGKAIDVYPSNPKTHTAKVRFEVSNPKGKLKPEMRAKIEIKVKLADKRDIPDGMITASNGFTEPETRDAFADYHERTAYDKLIARLSKKYKVDFHLIKAIIRTESGFNPNAVSRRGAGGLMQLMPGTAQQMNVSDIFNPRENIEGGIRYFKYLVSRFNNDLALSLAAYNVGEKMVAQFKGIPPYPETMGYVKKVMALYHAYKS